MRGENQRESNRGYKSRVFYQRLVRMRFIRMCFNPSTRFERFAFIVDKVIRLIWN